MFLSKWLSHYIIMKNQWRLKWFLNFARKKNFLGLLVGIRINTHFHWKAQLFNLFKSSFKFFANKSLSNTTGKRDVTSANSSGFETRFSKKSFIYILRKGAVRELNLEKPLLQYWPMLSFELLELLFAFYLLESLPKYLVRYRLPHFILTYKKDLYAKLCWKP